MFVLFHGNEGLTDFTDLFGQHLLSEFVGSAIRLVPVLHRWLVGNPAIVAVEYGINEHHGRSAKTKRDANNVERRLGL